MRGPRAPVNRRPTLPPRFEDDPYLVSRIGRSALRHVALLPAEWPRERIIDAARTQAASNRFETIACFLCALPGSLAGRRLSAWFWDDADNHAWHLAGYAAFSQRCPEPGWQTDTLGLWGPTRPASLSGPEIPRTGAQFG